MVQGYYTLQDAAKVLSMSPDELKQMAQKNQIRSFQDRGTLRFRIQDIQEMARQRGAASDPDLPLGEAPPPTPRVPPPAGPKSPSRLHPATPKSSSKLEMGGPKTPPRHEVTEDVFDFSLEIDDRVDIGHEVLADQPGGAKGGPKSAPRSGAKPRSDSKKKSPQPPIPLAPAGSDSDVKLIADDISVPPGSDSDVKLVGAVSDSDVKIVPDGPTPRTPRKSGFGPTSPAPQRPSRLGQPQPDSAPPKRASRLGGAAQPPDSGVRLVPMDSDSDVKIVGAGSDEVPLGVAPPPSSTDSDIRLERYQQPASSDEQNMMLTEEINLDEELRKQEAALKQQPQMKVKPKSKLKFPTSSPFELSDNDVDASSLTPKSELKEDSSDFDLAPADASKPESSDFELAPAAPEPAAESINDDFSLELPPDENVLAEGPGVAALSGPTSGISLNNPVDAGISLEEPGGEAGSDMDFDLSLEVEATPKPALAPSPADSSSEFEISLDVDESSGQLAAAAGAEAGSMDSDSEFELTLDDSGQLQALEEQPQVKAEGEEKDIFETDFEVPALEEESGSQVAALDTDLESSDFDIQLDDSAVEAGDEESGSQVVALDEEADEASATVAAEEGDLEIEVEAEEGFAGLGGEGEEEVEAEIEEEEAEGPVKEVVKEKLIEAAPWGPLPTVFMLPCLIVMVLVGLLGFELLQSAAGYKPPGMLTKAVGQMIGQNIK